MHTYCLICNMMGEPLYNRPLHSLIIPPVSRFFSANDFSNSKHNHSWGLIEGLKDANMIQLLLLRISVTS